MKGRPALPGALNIGRRWVEMFPFLLLLRKAIQIINAVERSLLLWRLPGWAPHPPQSGIF